MNLEFEDKLESVAEGLATDGYSVVDGFLTSDQVYAIVALPDVQHPAGFHKAGIGQRQEKQIVEAIRGDYIRWIERHTADPALKVYLAKLDQLIHFIRESLFISLKDYEVHLAMYPPGSFYKRHLDQFRKDDHRKLSVICYLNREWKEEEGGQLRIYLPDGTTQDVWPEAGRLVCFRSDLLEHEVLPATRPRLSLTGWILDQYAELKHL
jgi:SM-20-related protein